MSSMKIIKVCLNCKKNFLWSASPSRVKLKWGKFCSKNCKSKYWTPFIKPWKNSIGKPAHNRGKIQLSTRDENNPNWKGDRVKYGGLHAWIVLRLGKPKKCELCGITSSKKYEWANKSGEYKRDLSDWIRLCTSCHHKYDDITIKRLRGIDGKFINSVV